MNDSGSHPDIATHQLADVLAAFDVPGPLVAAVSQAGGNIHDSFRVEVEAPDGPRTYLLQLLNQHVFTDVPIMLDNITRVCAHLRDAVAAEGLHDGARRVPELVRTTDGEPGYHDARGRWWRLFPFIGDTRSTVFVETPDEARQIGIAFGAFLRRVASFAGEPLAVTIPRFHDTAWRLEQLEEAVASDPHQRAGPCVDELAFARNRAGLADVIPTMTEAGELPPRVVHNDAKPANVLLDAQTGEGLCVIDLDTVMPGTALHDMGDMLRASISTAGADKLAVDSVDVHVERLAALIGGWLGECRDLITPGERDHLVFAGLLLTYEQGVRYLTDHIAGDVYFRGPPGRNLARARNQFALARALDRRRDELERLVAEL